VTACDIVFQILRNPLELQRSSLTRLPRFASPGRKKTDRRRKAVILVEKTLRWSRPAGLRLVFD